MNDQLQLINSLSICHKCTGLPGLTDQPNTS